MHLRELWHNRLAAWLCLALAIVAGLSAAFRISVLPPGLHTRSLDIASASTRLVVDTPSSSLLDVRESTGDFQAMTNRAVLLGNIMASLPVRDYIARRAHIPAQSIVATTPLTPAFPRPAVTTDTQKHTSDLLHSPEEYRLNIQANPTVPVLDVYAEAPTTDKAKELADAAVRGLRDYLRSVAVIQGIGASDQVRLAQLGVARGGVINHGVRLQAALLAFLLAFGVSAAAVIFIARVRRGFKQGPAGLDDGPGEPTPATP